MTYRAAIEETVATIRLRARMYRDQVVAIVLLGISIMALAIMLESVRVLLAVACAVPVCGLFLVRDGQLLGRWRSSMLAAWVSRDLDFAALFAALYAFPALPKGTLESMCASLPGSTALAAEQQLSFATRKAIAAEFDSSQREHMNALVTRVVGWGLLLAAAFAAARGGFWVLAVLSAAWCAMAGVQLRARLVRSRRRAREIAACRADPTFNEDAYRRTIDPVPTRKLQ